ncbi:Uncharacterised protein [Mycobacteroides abscessus]|nr:Uncharacterised protein [Mycobacteroides abscessus]CPV05229.1 Uncharacterised protein [Mycobacteroides abscessus]
MDPATVRLMQRARSFETTTERAVRDHLHPQVRGLVPKGQRAMTLMRLWAQPEVQVRLHHSGKTADGISRARPHAWRLMWISLAVMLMAQVVVGLGAHTDVEAGIAVMLLFFLAATFGACVFRIMSIPNEVRNAWPSLAHTAWELAEPLECEGIEQWNEILTRTVEYIELREQVFEFRSIFWFQDEPSPEAEQVRFHLRCAALSMRQGSAASLAARTAEEGGDGALAVVPKLRADLAWSDFEQHLHQADEAMEALRPLALAATVQDQMAPLRLPAPELASSRRAITRAKRIRPAA